MSEDLAWVAGFWEGTGGVTLHPQKNIKSSTGFYYNCRFSFYQPELGLDALLTVQNILHSNGIHSRIYTVTKAKGDEQARYKCMISKQSDNLTFCNMIGKHVKMDRRKYQHQLAHTALIIISRGEHLTGEGFMKLVAISDEMRKHKTVGIQKTSKYTSEYFENLFG